jgi:hypothetical protein
MLKIFTLFTLLTYLIYLIVLEVLYFKGPDLTYTNIKNLDEELADITSFLRLFTTTSMVLCGMVFVLLALANGRLIYFLHSTNTSNNINKQYAKTLTRMSLVFSISYLFDFAILTWFWFVFIGETLDDGIYFFHNVYVISAPFMDLPAMLSVIYLNYKLLK